MVEVAQVLDEMVTPREAFFSNAVASRYCAWKLGHAACMDRCLVSLEIGKAGEVGRGGAVGIVASPCPGKHQLAGSKLKIVVMSGFFQAQHIVE